MSDALEALFGEKPEAGEAQKAADAAQVAADDAAAAVASIQPRDETGRFAPKTVAPEQPKAATPEPVVTPPAPEPVKAPEAKQPSEHGGLTGPALAAVLDEREKRKTLEKELSELRAKFKQQPERIPSIQENPEEFAAHLQRQIATAEWTTRCNASEDYAREKHGDALVDEALQWSLKKIEDEATRLGYSVFRDQQTSERRPVDWIVRQYRQHQLLSELDGDETKVKSYIEKRARELGLIPQTPAPQAQTPAATQPAPRQPAKADPFKQFDSAPSAGGPMTPMATPNPVVERLFGKT